MVSMNDVNSHLAHYGVKGQRWGVRRTDAQLRKGPSEDAKKIGENHRVAKKTGTKALSTKELQELVTRLNLEQQYSRMNPSTRQKGHATVKNLLAVGVTVNSAILFAQSPAGKAIAKALKR